MTAGIAVSSTALAQVAKPQPPSNPPSGLAIRLNNRVEQQDKTLAFHNLHTGEKLQTTFFTDGQFLPESLKEINHLLRDHRNNQVGAMNPALMMLLHNLQSKLDGKQPFHIISGYRSAETNAMLSKRSKKVAKKSLHMLGKAIDIRLPGTDIKHLHRAALSLQGGGVGLYTRSDFVHLDVGRFRQWGS
ncbi:DUF882 domain-containing protein [Amphritea sp. HPY]|uniref:DUF882 domain-containing protein n=1 Tax=Amphritea sp. HPY TaxID=3421652 RepID=UPI003D7EBA96